MDHARATELLAAERLRIQEALDTLSAGDGPSDGQFDDEAAVLYDAEFDAGRSDDLRDELAAVERAEQRLAAGTYGRSIESGEPIPDERLEILPAAERTAEEQERFEGGK
jgi:DnaK suppressor protein